MIYLDELMGMRSSPNERFYIKEGDEIREVRINSLHVLITYGKRYGKFVSMSYIMEIDVAHGDTVEKMTIRNCTGKDLKKCLFNRNVFSDGTREIEIYTSLRAFVASPQINRMDYLVFPEYRDIEKIVDEEFGLDMHQNLVWVWENDNAVFEGSNIDIDLFEMKAVFCHPGKMYRTKEECMADNCPLVVNFFDGTRKVGLDEILS